jgi:large subunit ribosomal protein L30
MASKLRVTLIRSGINRPEQQKRTIRGLGLGKMGVAVTLPDNVSVRGMIRAVSHLVRVEKAE